MKRYHRYLISLFLILATGLFIDGCRKKFIPEEFELISSRFGEFKMFDQIIDGKLVKRIIFKNDDVYESANLQLVQLNQIIQLASTDMFLFTVESFDDNSECPAKFLVITLNADGKFKTFPEIGNCNDIPDVQDNGEQVTDFINKIQAATMRGKNMVTQILKVAQKKSEPTLKIDLVKIIKETIGELELAKPNHIKISFITKLEQAALDATEANIHQVIYNLCNNAIYAMKNNEIGNLSINLDKIPILDEMKQIIHSPGFQFSYQIIVSDDGAGIKQTDLDKIFEPFFTTKQDKGGTGLGLASVYSIIQNLQGTISVVSKEKIGTKFTINLPCN
jgi:signal transduction histidine kinase